MPRRRNCALSPEEREKYNTSNTAVSVNASEVTL